MHKSLQSGDEMCPGEERKDSDVYECFHFSKLSLKRHILACVCWVGGVGGSKTELQIKDGMYRIYQKFF